MNSISCIVPIYGINKNKNLEYFLCLLSSVQEASKKLDNFELIIVNDDVQHISREQIIEACTESMLLDQLVYLENPRNYGQAYSRNIGAKHARFEYLHFIDQDDYISRDFYDFNSQDQDMCEFFIARPFFYIQDRSILKKAYTPFLISMYKCAKTLSDLWILLLVNIAYSPGQVIMSKRLFDKYNGFPILKNKGSDDYGLFFHMVMDGKIKFRFLSSSYFYYRTHRQQSSRNCNMNASVLEFLKSTPSKGWKSRFIHIIRQNRFLVYFIKLFYVIVYKKV